MNALLDDLSKYAEENGFKIILLSSDQLIAMNILRSNPRITNMTKDILDQDTCIKWANESMEQFLEKIIHGPLIDKVHYTIKYFSWLSKNPRFAQILMSSYYNVPDSERILIDPDNENLNKMADHYAEQWRIGISMIRS